MSESKATQALKYVNTVDLKYQVYLKVQSFTVNTESVSVNCSVWVA